MLAPSTSVPHCNQPAICSCSLWRKPLLAYLLLLTCSLSYCRNSLGLNWTLSGAVECEGPLYPSEESLRELGISGPTLLHCSDQDA